MQRLLYIDHSLTGQLATFIMYRRCFFVQLRILPHWLDGWDQLADCMHHGHELQSADGINSLPRAVPIDKGVSTMRSTQSRTLFQVYTPYFGVVYRTSVTRAEIAQTPRTAQGVLRC